MLSWALFVVAQALTMSVWAMGVIWLAGKGQHGHPAAIWGLVALGGAVPLMVFGPFGAMVWADNRRGHPRLQAGRDRPCEQTTDGVPSQMSSTHKEGSL